ncbi:unnamed protein product [Polarella glacialis]|uniref:Uncharacterized protein n=1 Tax=Polarella glacialis TaxID=89957 RepID=A0A813IB77_POLGL|nr:unnamed protein product [Polarella glacialis]
MIQCTDALAYRLGMEFYDIPLNLVLVADQSTEGVDIYAKNQALVGANSTMSRRSCPIRQCSKKNKGVCSRELVEKMQIATGPLPARNPLLCMHDRLAALLQLWVGPFQMWLPVA